MLMIMTMITITITIIILIIIIFIFIIITFYIVELLFFLNNHEPLQHLKQCKVVFRPAQSNIPCLSSPQCLFPSDILQHFVSKTLTLSCPTSTFVDFTLSNARRFYSSMGYRLGRKGLS